MIRPQLFSKNFSTFVSLELINEVPLKGQMQTIAQLLNLPLKPLYENAINNAKQRNIEPLNEQIGQELLASFQQTAMKIDTHVHGLRYAIPGSPLVVPPTFEKLHELFILKKPYTPYHGLQIYLKGPTDIDCGGAIDSLWIQAIADALGEEKFNILFSRRLLDFYFMFYGNFSDTLELFSLPVCTDFSSTNRSHLRPGDRLFFENIPWYSIKHPTGYGHGYHAIYLGTDKERNIPLYWALGLKRLVTESELEEILLAEYNMPQSKKTKEEIAKFGSAENFIACMQEIHGSLLTGWDAKIADCYQNPERPLTLKEAKKAGLGFWGYAQVKRLSHELLTLLKETPTTTFTDPKFLEEIAKCQIASIAALLLKCPPDSFNTSKTNWEAIRFRQWITPICLPEILFRKNTGYTP